MTARGNFIGGKWLEPSHRREVRSPSNSEVVGVVDDATPETVEKAVSAARGAFSSWQAVGVDKRCQILTQFADALVEEYGNEGEETPLKRLISQEMGKTLFEADIEVIESSDMVRYFADNSARLLSSQPIEIASEMWASKCSVLRFEPRGVVAVIKPWNYPLELPLWAIAPALAAGNTVVFKPSEMASLVGLKMAEILDQAGLPAGVLNVITGQAPTGIALVDHPDIDMVSFTGSRAAGVDISVRAGRRLLPTSIELGGVDAAIVLEDADLELAANGVVWGATCNSGQVCVGTKRVLVQNQLAAKLTDSIIEKVEKLRPGVDYGPIVSGKQLAEIERQIEDAVSKGARLVSGGSRDETEKLYFRPAVLTEVSPEMNIVKHECFGPVIPIMEVGGTDEEIAQRVNNSEYGLGASIWTADRERGKALAELLDVGTVWINDVNVALAEAPWSGRRASGHGVDLSPWGLYKYAALKHISIETSDDKTRDWWYPYS